MPMPCCPQFSFGVRPDFALQNLDVPFPVPPWGVCLHTFQLAKLAKLGVVPVLSLGAAGDRVALHGAPHTDA